MYEIGEKMVDFLVIINIVVALLAIGSAIYFLSILSMVAGKFKTGLILIISSFIVIIIEHFVIAYLRRSDISLDSFLWFIPMPLYLIFLALGVGGVIILRKTFLEVVQSKISNSKK